MSKGYSGLFVGTKGNKSVNFYVNSYGKTLESKYKKWIGVNRRERLLSKAKNSKLRNAINELYRPGSIIGDGGTASALKFEYKTGIGILNGKNHEQKARDYAKYLTKIINKENLCPSDLKLARYLRKKLIKALGEKHYEKH